jgi:PHP family Zn ribbon phosphoesterase
MTVLDERRKMLLLVRFRHLDEMLSEVDRLADGKRPSSLFAGGCDPLVPNEREAIHGYAVRLRQRMCGILAEKEVRIDAPQAEIGRTIHNLLMFMDIAVDELRPKYVKGYGELTKEAADELDSIATELQGIFKEMQAVLKRS